MNKLTFSILCLTIGQLFAFSGHVTKDTIWSTDVIVTGNVVVDSAATLTIAKGVNVQFVRSDTNSDGNGDITFFVNGKIRSQGTSALPITFKSYETVPQRNDWHGLVFAGTGYCGNSIAIKNAVVGVIVNSKCRNMILNQFNVSSCVTGIYTDSVADSVYFYNFTIDSSKYAGVIQLSTKIRMFNTRAIHSDSGGLLINQSTVAIQNSQFDTNGVYGLKLISSQSSTSSLTATYSNFCSNKGYGIWVDSLSGLTATYCNISFNSKTGVLIKSNSLQSSLINNCNINANSIYPDTINLTSLNYDASIAYFPSDPYNKGWYKFPAHYNSMKVQYYMWQGDFVFAHDAQGDTQLSFTSTVFGSIGSTNWINSVGLLRNDSICLTFLCPRPTNLAGIFANLEAVTFSNPYQLIYLTNTMTSVNAQLNYWGQVTGIDTVIGTQSLVNYSNYQTVAISAAGYQPSSFAQNINVAPLSCSFNNVPLNFIDSCTVVVQNTGKDILVCEDISSNNNVFSANTNNIYLFGLQNDTIKVKFSPDSIKSESGYLTIPTNVTGKEITQVVLQGTGVPADHAPTYSELMPDTLVIAGTTLNRSHPATDIDAGDSLAYSVVSGPTGLTYVSGIISWAIPSNAVNSTVIVKAVDRYGLSASDTFLLSINHPPMITSVVPDSNLSVGQAYTYDVNATDQDGDGLTYFLDSLVGSMIISPSSGLISFTPTVNDTGKHTVLVRVTDSRGASTFQKYHLIVKPASGTLRSKIASVLPKAFNMSGYRSPSGRFSIDFAIPAKDNKTTSLTRKVTIAMYDLRGCVLKSVVNGYYLPGYYSISFSGNFSFSPAILKMQSENYSSTRILL